MHEEVTRGMPAREGRRKSRGKGDERKKTHTHEKGGRNRNRARKRRVTLGSGEEVERQMGKKQKGCEEEERWEMRRSRARVWIRWKGGEGPVTGQDSPQSSPGSPSLLPAA